MLSKEIEYQISVECNQYFIDEFKGGYPIDEMNNICNAYKAGATAWAVWKEKAEGYEKALDEINEYISCNYDVSPDKIRSIATKALEQ